MGLGLGVTIFLIIIGLVIASVFASDLINKATVWLNQEAQLLKQTATTSQLSPRANAGQNVCNLRVDVSGNLDNPPSFPAITGKPLQFYFNSQSITYSWFNCYQSGTLSLVPFYLTNYTSPLSLLGSSSLNLAGGAGEAVSVQLVLNGNDGSKVDASVQPNMQQSVLLPNGIFPTPYNFHLTYVVNNIPQQHYQLSVYAGRNINDLAVGVPYVVQVN